MMVLLRQTLLQYWTELSWQIAKNFMKQSETNYMLILVISNPAAAGRGRPPSPPDFLNSRDHVHHHHRDAPGRHDDHRRHDHRCRAASSGASHTKRVMHGAVMSTTVHRLSLALPVAVMHRRMLLQEHMETRRLGKTGFEIGCVALGCWQIGCA